MSLCGICNATVQKDVGGKISCAACSCIFHGPCLKLSEKELKAARSSDPKWRCARCAKDRRMSTGSNASSVASKKSNPSKESSLDAFRRVFEERVTEMIANNQKTNSILENAMCLIDSLKADTCELKKDTVALVQRADLCESRLREQARIAELHSIEILDVPATIKGDLYVNASSMLTTALNIEVPEEAIGECYVINLSKKTKGAKSDKSPKRGNIWIVKLLSKRIRDCILDIVRQRGRNGGWKLDCKSAEGHDYSIRVRERISSYTRELYAEARKAAADCGWKYVWIRDGRLHVRVGEEERVTIVNSPSDISKLING